MNSEDREALVGYLNEAETALENAQVIAYETQYDASSHKVKKRPRHSRGKPNLRLFDRLRLNRAQSNVMRLLVREANRKF